MSEKRTSALATMAEPIDEDCAHALIVSVYQAREQLALAERQADAAVQPTPQSAATAMTQLQTGLAHLNGASAMALELPKQQTSEAGLFLARAISATEAALGHVKVYALSDGAEHKQITQLRNIWRRAARASKQEAHRALHELAQQFPNAYDVEEEGL